MELLTYLRCSRSLTQSELAQKTGLSPNDISRFENQHYPGMSKVSVLAKFFEVKIDALLTNDFPAVFKNLSAPMMPSHKLSHKCDEKLLRNSKTGRDGEEYVFRRELDKLQGTEYQNAVNPNFANDAEAGFDILSFSVNGDPIVIEVKSTTDLDNQSFEMTAREIEKLKMCVNNGERYELQRVFGVGTPDVHREIISGDELLKDYDFEPQVTYRVHPKKKVTK